MVINSQDQITEAVAYQAYGAMDPLDSIANAPEIPAREKFTGKEFDQEGEDSANGVVGIQAYHFGARVYDPEVGVFLSTDPQDIYWNSYSYVGGNPIFFMDPNGEHPVLIGALIGAGVGFVGGGLIGGAIDDKQGAWSWAGAGIGMVGGAIIGGAIGEAVYANQLASQLNQGNELFALQERLAKANSEIAQLERVLSNVGTKSVGTLVPDNADLIYQYLTMNKGGWGIPVSRSIITFEAANIISNILAHTPHGVIEKPIHTNKNVWKADEHYYTGHELINKDLGILQRGISDAATSSPLATPNLFPMVKNPVSNYFLNDMAIEAIQKAVQKGVKK